MGKKIYEKLEQNLKLYYSSLNLKYYGNYNYIDSYLIRKSIKKNTVKDIGLRIHILKINLSF